MGDFPANPLEKPGYRLDFHDEFDGSELDPDKWVPYYLPQWSSRALSAPRYRLEDSNLVLEIAQEQPPWCPEFDGKVRCSSIQPECFRGQSEVRSGSIALAISCESEKHSRMSKSIPRSMAILRCGQMG
jgi:hypothetical protein